MRRNWGFANAGDPRAHSSSSMSRSSVRGDPRAPKSDPKVNPKVNPKGSQKVTPVEKKV